MIDKEIIQNWVEPNWHLLVKRPDIPPLPVVYKALVSNSLEMKELYGTRLPWTIFWQENQMEIYLQSSALEKVIQNSTEKLLSGSKIDSMIKDMEKWCGVAKTRAENFSPKKLNTESIAEHWEEYKNIIDAYQKSFIRGFITWFTVVLQKRAKEIIQDYAGELEGVDLEPESALSILISSEKQTPYNDKEAALDNISKKFSKGIKKLNYSYKDTVADKNPDLHRSILKFLDDYKWVGYDYNGPVISYKEVLQILEDRELPEDKMPKKQEVVDICKFSEDEEKVFRVLSLMSYIKDKRNSTDDYIHYTLDGFYNRAAKHLSIDIDTIKYLTPDELEDVLYSGDTAALQNKSKLAYFGQEEEKFYSDKQAEEKRKIFHDKLGKDKEEKNSSSIRGTVASSGKVRGRVKLVSGFKEIDKVKEGDILVTSMTSPRYMQAISKSAAIVTDEGGLTSHAAIISRELKKPCIIGTKHATQVFKDGDEVEVDAEKGVVRRINEQIS